MKIRDFVMDVPMNTRFGQFLSGAYQTFDPRTGTNAEHMLVYLNLNATPCNLRLNSACYTSGIFGDDRCDCTWQLEYTLDYIQRCQQGLVMYHMNHEGRANGLIAKLRSFEAATLHNQHGARAYTSLGMPSDAREFDSAVAILKSLSIRAVNLISNNLQKQRILEDCGISVVARVPVVSHQPHLRQYYDWKREDFHHHV